MPREAMDGRSGASPGMECTGNCSCIASTSAILGGRMPLAQGTGTARQLLLRCSARGDILVTYPGSSSIPSQRPLLSCSAMCRKFFSLSGWMAPLFMVSMSAQLGSLRWVQLLNWQFPR